MLYSPEWEKKDAEITPREPWREVCLTAADLLEKHGHCKGTVVTRDKHMCLYGALQAAVYGLPWIELGGWACSATQAQRDAYADASCHVENFVRKHGYLLGAVHWNDAKERKPEEVIALLREVANAV